ncbi:unnamed protein product [Taenia asiatica]|uniref:Uncharacterized protein n=1 Tax=Taenia asiatica TaxID=60517 RepID=A0A0R3VUH8_TAEAS|nr:unnamed protein product [Taenia asiatica]
MDARLKFRHLRPANVAILNAKVAQVNRDTTKMYESLSLLARSRDSMHDTQMHRIHFVIWLDACRKHQKTSRKLFNDLKTYVYNSTHLNSFSWDEKNSSLLQMVESQSLDLENFKVEVIQPLNQLRLEIKKSLRSNQNLRAALRDAYANIEAETFKLLQCETEINAFPPTSRWDNIERLRGEDTAEDKSGGIPAEAWQWDTHDEKFRADLLSEFVHLDAAFIKRVKGAKMEFLALASTCGLNEWKLEDFHLVEFLWDVYNASETPQKRRNCIDLLKRFPSAAVGLLSRPRCAQSEIGRCCIGMDEGETGPCRPYPCDIGGRYGRGLQEKARKVECGEAESVQRWRREKAELEDLEFRARETKRAAEMARMKERQEREDRRRQTIKNKIQTQRQLQLQEKAEFEAAEHLRLEELRRVFDRQRHQDTRRLLEIAKKHLQRQSARRAEASEEAARRAEAMETRLEAIRVKVMATLIDQTSKLEVVL